MSQSGLVQHPPARRLHDHSASAPCPPEGTAGSAAELAFTPAEAAGDSRRAQLQHHSGKH
eukprot:201930-Hanusia_phi.AAC.1